MFVEYSKHVQPVHLIDGEIATREKEGIFYWLRTLIVMGEANGTSAIKDILNLFCLHVPIILRCVPTPHVT